MPAEPTPRLPLARAMRARGLTTRDLASAIGVHRATVSRLVNGRQCPHPVTAGLIAETLGTSPAALGLTRSEGGAA